MKNLRSLHLYLGCIFAPMLLFFAVSGLWQTSGLHWSKGGGTAGVLTYLSTIHTGRGLKGELKTLSSPLMEWFVVLMALSLIFTIILGIVMAFKFGRGRTAILCLLAGFLVPVALVYYTLAS